MCNTCGSSGCGCNNGNNSNGGCVNLLRELSDAINNFFTNPCSCGCNNQWRNGFQSGYAARGNSPAWRNGFESGWQARANNGGCGCSNNGNYDSYYARQYGLN